MSASASSHEVGAARLDGPAEGTRRVLLVGRPNSGKSSLYNLVTGGNARVGNFPGVTVDALEAEVAADGARLRLVDLPGIYSVDAATDPASDEGHARSFLEEAERIDGPMLVAQIADATQLALGLRLTAELLARRAPLALVVTQLDVLEREGRVIDTAALEAALGVPVLAVSARDPATRPRLLDFLARSAARGARSADRDRAVGREGRFDPEALAKSAVREREDANDVARRLRLRTDRIDRVLLHPLWGLTVFVGIMTLLFASVFLVAEPVTSLIDSANRALGGIIEGWLGEGLLSSLLIDGILGGAGTVLAFLPQIVILTLAMEVIDASGYLSRGAFLVDRLLRAAGLGGRSFVPLLTAHACAVPAIQATRAIRDPGQRLRTILVLPLMTCSARIPTYGLLIATFFAARGALWKGALFVSLYFAGILSGLIASLVLGRTVMRATRPLPLLLEMPAYRVPQARVVARVAGRTVMRFLKDVGSVILVASVVLWVLLSVPGPKMAGEAAPPNSSVRVERMHKSLAAFVGRELEPVTRAAGFDWRINVGLMGSFGARELMVSTMGVIFGIEGDDAKGDVGPLAERIRVARSSDGRPAYSAATGLALMAFFILACQCMSTLASIRRETHSVKWAVFVAVYTYVAAFALAVVVFRAARLVGL